ncbi:cathepsin L-like isoform X3 [Vanessa atalanta]|uniref:cathepsin L-like isoform X3 n=1 Tax=Vanessa atalanta TaxID=42275 RepID=UPI001FCD8D7A|nr:cathepsin L-like isoform X3 [Vanessa atalanta]
MRSLAVLLVVVAVVGADSFVDFILDEWKAFKLIHQKSYENEIEELFRMKIYAENKLKIKKHNQLFESGQVTYRLGVNKYADMLQHEFMTMNGFNRTGIRVGVNKTPSLRGATYLPPANVAIPELVDWRSLGAVTEVKDQGSCGSCWAFSTTGSLEGQQFRKSNILVSLSEQNLIDCSFAYGNLGCNGGLMPYAYTYIHENGGIDTEESYPYEECVKTCRFDPVNVGAEVVGFMDLPEGDEEILKQAVANVGPVSVAIDASRVSFQLYSSGVYHDEQCSSSNLSHGVLVVGYGTDEEGGDYWLVKNSWGSSWGENGYIKMARNRGNNCGIASFGSYPLV